MYSSQLSSHPRQAKGHARETEREEMNESHPPLDEAAKTALFHAQNAVLHCKQSWKELKDALGKTTRNIAENVDSKACEACFLKLEESINHVERTYEEVKRDDVLSTMLREARESRPPFVLTAKIPKERSVFFGSSLGNLLSHYEGRFPRRKEFFEATEKKMKKMIGGMTPYDGSVVAYAVDERGKRIGFNAFEVNEKCHMVKVISSGNFECRAPWDGWNIESILELEIGPDDWKKREEEEREEEDEEAVEEPTKKRAKKVANAKKSWTDGPGNVDAKKKDEDASSSIALEFAKVSLRKKSVAEMVGEKNEKKAFEKFTKMARERAKENIKKYCGDDGKKGAAVMALAMLLEWFEDFHTTSRAAKKAKERDDNGGGGGGEMEADPRTCGVEVQKRYLPEYYKDSETKNMTYQDVAKQEQAKEKKGEKAEEGEEEEEGEVKE